MTSDERELKRLVSRRLPSHMEFVVARDRVLNELHAAPPHLQRARLADTPPAPSEPGGRVEGPAVSWLRTALPMAAAAALIAMVATASLWHGDWLATVEAADGSKYTLKANEVMRASSASGAMLTLMDGSRVEMRAASELSLDRAADGLDIRLRGGDIIVNAAKRRAGHLYVQTSDMTVAPIVGTVFLVNAGTDGSRVGVIEGEVRVRERGTPLRRSGRPGGRETLLRPGEQLATSPVLAARPVRDDILWSRNANAHLTILENFMKGMSQTAGVLAPLAPPQQAPAAATTPAGPEFEEASIRECDPDNVPAPPAGARGGGANSLQMTPGRLYALCLTPATLVRTAYGYAPGTFFGNGGRGRGMRTDVVYGLGVEDGLRVRGGPDWVRNEHYTIEAVAATPADAETMRGPMLRVLLERRFGLKAHVETEQIPARALTIAPGGLKMKEGTCTGPAEVAVPQPAPVGTPVSTVDMVRKNLDAARRGATTVSPCGYYGAANGPNMIFVGAGAGLPGVGGPGGTPVINRTGIPDTTRFNYVLEYLPDDTSGFQVRPGMQISGDSSSVPPAPPLEIALEQQLGLRLEPAQAPREFIVIDAIKRPDPN